MIIINDIHLGVSRQGGTTPSSREALSEYLFEQFDGLLANASDAEEDLVILGDLFDSFEVAPRDWLETYKRLADWCNKNPLQVLYLVAGNHDISMKGSKVSSFETLSEVLQRQFTNVSVTGIDGVLKLKNVFLVAHHRNQEIFDMSLADLLKVSKMGDYAMLHANYLNKFAAESDHSLNVSEELACQFSNKGVTLVFAHEHQSRVEIPHGANGNCASVVVLGNQIPTSVADCLGNDEKYFWQLTDLGLVKHRCWSVDEGAGFAQIDWRHLSATVASELTGFVRVVGDAANAEAAEVIDAIHKFRQKAKAFVVSNAVKIDGIAEIDDLPEQFEAAKRFDVMEFVYAQLNDAESAVIRKLVEEME